MLISHRFSTVRMADRILVLKGGELVWDKVHRDYVYTDAWVERLVEVFANVDQYQSILGGNKP